MQSIHTMSASEIQNNFPNNQEMEGLFPDLQKLTLISKGKVSCVYHANDTLNNRDVVIKVYPKDLSSDKEYLALFNDELNALKKIRNRSIAKIYDSGEVDGHLFTIMEFVNGRPMHDSIDGNIIETIIAAKIINNVCIGLDAAHTKNITHRNISPHNILLNSDAKPKLINFGFTKNLYSSDEDDWGKSGYTAPEAIHDPQKSDKRSDVYSVGIILKQMLTGTQASDFTKNTADNEVITNIPKELQRIIDKATAKSPSSRYSSAGTMGLVLMDAIENLEDAAESGLKTATPAHLAAGAQLKTATPANKNNASRVKAGSAVTTNRIKAETSTASQSSHSSYVAAPTTTKSSSALYAFLLILILGAIPLLIYVSKSSSSNTTNNTVSDFVAPPIIDKPYINTEEKPKTTNNTVSDFAAPPIIDKPYVNTEEKPKTKSKKSKKSKSKTNPVEKNPPVNDSEKTKYGTSSGVIAPFAPTK